MARKATGFRVGSVQGYLRNRVWYLCYHEQGQRRRPRVGPDKDAARTMAAQINAELASGAPTTMGFRPVALTELQTSWLSHHEHVLRSSVQTINRYRTATAHLLRFLQDVRPVRNTSLFSVQHAEEFVRYLRTIEVAPNGHKNTPKRRLLDKGVKYILETCRSMFNFALKRRHLSPYSENPFAALDLEKIPVENSKAVTLLSDDQEQKFLEACDDWQLPIFITLMLTGLRPGELTHLLLPDDLDLEAGLLRVQNKPRLGWMVKTRNERIIPLVSPLLAMFRSIINGRRTGPIVVRRRFWNSDDHPVLEASPSMMERELQRRVETAEREQERSLTRAERLTQARRLWVDAGSAKPDRIRTEFMRLTRRIGAGELTSPKALRHLFATSLQDTNVDPLIRNELMGHSPAGARGGGSGLGMTAVYTHTRWETKLKQLESSLAERPAFRIAETKYRF